MRYQRAVIWCATLTIATGCSTGGDGPLARGGDSIQVGGLYAMQEADGAWRVTKVLAVDDSAVHLRSYSNRFPEQPKDVEPAKLRLGGMNDPDGMGIGHYPLAKEAFFKENPVLIKVVAVEEEELEGYKMYLEAMQEGR